VTTTPPRPPERSLPADAASALEEGIRRFRARDFEGAHEMFGMAHRRAPSDPRVQSWYGLTLVVVEKNSNLGVVLVDEAVRNGRPDPELIINQSHVYMALGQRVRAVRALERGLAIHPGQGDLQDARTALGRRRKPVIPFLSRGNPLNRALGRLQHRWSSRRPTHPDPPPEGED
jgi:hypothetical protein